MIRGTTILPGGIRSSDSRVEVVWETLSPHPKVMEYTTQAHRQIVDLGVTDGTMLIAYGDWTQNLGPVSVIGYNLQTLAPVTLFANATNEGWGRINIIDGKAFLPHTDPTLDNQGAYTTNERGVWETVKIGTNTSMIHSFDIIKFNGLMMCCGSAGINGTGMGVVWTETAPGSREFTRTLMGSSREDFARFYKFYPVGNKVRVQNVAGGLETWITEDGANWEQESGVPSYTGNNTGWDLTEVTSLPAGYIETSFMSKIWSKYEHDGWLWIGGFDGVVKRARLPSTNSPGPFPSKFTTKF